MTKKKTLGKEKVMLLRVLLRRCCNIFEWHGGCLFFSLPLAWRSLFSPFSFSPSLMLCPGRRQQAAFFDQRNRTYGMALKFCGMVNGVWCPEIFTSLSSLSLLRYSSGVLPPPPLSFLINVLSRYLHVLINGLSRCGAGDEGPFLPMKVAVLLV